MEKEREAAFCWLNWGLNKTVSQPIIVFGGICQNNCIFIGKYQILEGKEHNHYIISYCLTRISAMATGRYLSSPNLSYYLYNFLSSFEEERLTRCKTSSQVASSSFQISQKDFHNFHIFPKTKNLPKILMTFFI